MLIEELKKAAGQLPTHPAGMRREKEGNMIYEVTVTINNSPTKVTGWGYLIKADSPVNAKLEALNRAKVKAYASHSRYKRCTFTIQDGDCIARPDW